MKDKKFLHVFLRNIWNDKGSGRDSDIALYPIADDLDTVKSGCFMTFDNYNFAAYEYEDLSWAIRKDATYEVKPEDITTGN